MAERWDSGNKNSPITCSSRMLSYSFQDSLRIGRNGKWGPPQYERKDFTPKQLKRIRKKENYARRHGWMSCPY